MSAANWGIGGGGKYLFSGPKCPPSKLFQNYPERQKRTLIDLVRRHLVN